MNAYLAIALVAALLALAVVLWGLKQRVDAANERRTITVNGKKYRVRFERIRKSAEEANERACRRCAFFDYYNCGGANCAKFIRTNRRDVETHYAYFRRLPDPGKRDDLAAALGAIVIVALLAFLITGCCPCETMEVLP